MAGAANARVCRLPQGTRALGHLVAGIGSAWEQLTGVALHGDPCPNGVDLTGRFHLTIYPGGPAFTLTVTGTCPGQRTFSVSGGTPGGMIA